MKKIRSLSRGFLLLFLILGIISCTGTKMQLKKEANEKTPPQQISQSQPEIASSSQDEPSVSNPMPTQTLNPPPSQPSTPPRLPVQTPSQPPISPSPILRPTEPQTGRGVVFNFNNADLNEVIRVMAEIMKINYLVDPKVKGVVNIHTAGQISNEDVFSIFQSILKLNGATAVKKENIYEIVPFVDAKKTYTPPSISRETTMSPLEERYTIQIVMLRYIPVAEVSKMIKPFLSDGADIIEHPPQNILIIGDIASNIKKSIDIINLFDIDIFTDLRVRIYPILNADVTEIAKEMERIFSSFEVSLKSARGVGITFTPITRINSLLVVSSIPNIFEKVEAWLKELDKMPAEGTKAGIFVYYVQNGRAKDLADVLKQIFVTKKEKKEEFKEKVVTPEQTTSPRSVKPPSTSPSSLSRENEFETPEGEINIVVDETNNALAIRAFARDYKNILETIKKLDIYPKQVLIEVLLAEIKLDDSNKFGIEWARFIDTLSHGQYEQRLLYGATPTIPASSPGAGIFRYSIVEEAGRLTAAIKLAATDNRLDVISSPHVLASNNKEAKIQIGSSQPVLTSTYTTTATASTNVVEGTIEYKDIGIILMVTPRISDAGLITLEIQIELSDVDTKKLGTLENVPFFDKKTAKTTLSVLEGQTIVIGGLIKDKKDVKKSGIPFLSSIPVLGALFGSQEYVNEKTELVLLMTPHIITDHIQSRTVTEEFREKVEGIKKKLEKKREK